MSAGGDETQHLGQALRDAVLKAQIEYEAARQEFQSILNDIPSGIPHPDGALRIQRAGSETNSALVRYKKALDRYADFLLKKNVAEHDQS